MSFKNKFEQNFLLEKLESTEYCEVAMMRTFHLSPRPIVLLASRGLNQIVDFLSIQI